MSQEEQTKVEEQKVEEQKVEEQQVQEQKEDNSKASRGEKKFKKAMMKMGMKQVTGINRVTIKKSKQLMLFIDNPEILQSPGQDTSYIIFGEAKLQDFPGNIAADEAGKFKAPEQPEQQKEEEKKEEQKTEQVDDLSEDKLTPENITMVMEHCKCTREEAVRALNKNNDDQVNAILEIQGV